MEIYRFKCKCCGATRYKKPTKHIYRCLYCGEEVEVYRKADTEQTEQPVQVAPAPVQQQPKVKKPEPKLETKNLIMLIVCLAGGWFGLHKFLSGKVIWGLIYLFTWGVMGVGTFIDTMIYIIDFSKDYKKYHRELKDFEN